MILHIARTFFVQAFAFKLTKKVGRVFTHNVDKQVKTTTVWHPDHNFFTAYTTCTLNDFVDHWNKGLTAFNTKTLRANKFITQILFQTFSSRQTLQKAFFLISAEVEFTARTL